MEGTLRSLSSLGADTLVYHCQTLLENLPTVLRAHDLPQPTRHFLLQCSPEVVLRIFELIREQALESPSSLWYVISQSQNVSKRIEPLVREGTRVIVIEETKEEGNLVILGSSVTPEDTIRFRVIGSMTLTTGSTRFYLKEDLFPPLEEIYANFHGRNLLMCAVENWPFVVTTPRPDGKFDPDHGIDINVMNVLGQALNFTYNVIHPAKREWGNPQPDGTVTGIIGVVARHEAHVAIDEITMTARRETVVDFTQPYFLDSSSLVSRAPTEKSRVLAVISPLRLEVWMVLLCLLSLIGPVKYAIMMADSRHPGAPSPHRVHDLAYCAFRNLVVQGNPLPSKRVVTRIVFGFWFFFCLLFDGKLHSSGSPWTFSAIYAGMLTASLTIPSFEKPIDSLDDLLTAAKTRGTFMGYNPGSSHEGLFKVGKGRLKESRIEMIFFFFFFFFFYIISGGSWHIFSAKDGIYKDLLTLAFFKDKSYSFSTVDGLSKTLEKDYVYIGGWLSSKVILMRQGSHKYHLAKERFYPQGLSIACRSGSPFRRVFDKILTRVVQAGLVDKWTEDEISKVRASGAEDSSSPTRAASAITLVHLQAAFVILGLGVLSAALVLAFEVLISKFKD
ncbi:glutamate receptor ionotropic, delta-2-like [Oratosquilla oratoria]|uniref:glutamate receptor ionotropic, delta-2-like n=1 Tax=Oratosquilla oratoria TaxID=337810 RepID=UPI003F773A6E